MQIVERGIERIVAVIQHRASFVVAVYARAQCAFEVRHGGAVDEVIEVLLGGSGGLEDTLDRGFAEDGER